MKANGKRFGTLFALFVAVMMLMAACAPAPAAPAAETAGEAAPAKVKVKIGTNAEYQPFEFVDANNQIVGFDVDLLNALAEEANLELEWVNTKWDGIFVALANGEFDAVASAVTITDERKQTVDFTDPYFNAGQILAVLNDNTTIKTIEDVAEGTKIGVQLGTTGDIFVTDNTKAQVERFDELPMALQALANKDVEAVVADAPTLADFVKANPELNAMLVGEPFTDELYGVAVNKGKPEILEALNTALATVKANGKYDEIYNKWFGAEQ